jgi:hypothetical protein
MGDVLKMRLKIKMGKNRIKNFSLNRIANSINNEDDLYKDIDPINQNFETNESNQVDQSIDEDFNPPSLDLEEHGAQLDQYGQAIEACEKMIKKIESEHHDYFDRIDLEDIDQQDRMILMGNYNTVKRFHEDVQEFVVTYVNEYKKLQRKLDSMQESIMSRMLHSKQIDSTKNEADKKKELVQKIQSAIGRAKLIIEDIEDKI